MQLAHAADDGLAGLGIRYLEGRILFGDFWIGELSSWSLLVFGSMASMGRGRSTPARLLVRVAQGVTGGGVLEMITA